MRTFKLEIDSLSLYIANVRSRIKIRKDLTSNLENFHIYIYIYVGAYVNVMYMFGTWNIGKGNDERGQAS